MNRNRLQPMLRQFDKIADASALPDQELLARFATQRDDLAFQWLVERHAPMVFGICRHVLQHREDAEDASQATFLVLARNPSAIRKQMSLSCWLHGVAYRIACTMRRRKLRHKNDAAKSENAPPREPIEELTWLEGQRIVEEEIHRLPESLRFPVVLCYLQGKTRDEAATELNWTLATLRGRLDRAKERLKFRLERRGLALGAGFTSLLLANNASPKELITATLQAVQTGTIKPTVATLVAGGLRTMYSTKKIVLAGMLTLILVGGGAALFLAHQINAQDAKPTAKQNETPKEPESSTSPPATTPNQKAIAVTVSRPVKRDFAPYEVFKGRVQNIPYRQAIETPKPSEKRMVVVGFQVDELSYLKFKRLIASGKIKGQGTPLALGLADESDFPRIGHFNSFRPSFDQHTDTILAEGSFPNEDGLLLPNMTAKVRMTFGPPTPVLEVHDEAVCKDDGRPFVWVVNDRNIAEKRAVQLGPNDGGMRIVKEGLRPEDRVIIAGMRNLTLGERVEIECTVEQSQSKKK